MLLSAHLQCQELVDKRLNSELQKVVVEFGQIDHIELYSTESHSDIVVKAEGNGQIPNFQISETNNVVLIKDFKFSEEPSDLNVDKVCGVAPNYTTYKIYVPSDKDLFLSVEEGNFYAKDFMGDLHVKIQNGVANLSKIQQNVSIYVNSGKVYVGDIQNVKLDIKTNLGVLSSELGEDLQPKDQKKLVGSLGTTENSLYIRTILANIFLCASKG